MYEARSKSETLINCIYVFELLLRKNAMRRPSIKKFKKIKK